MTTITGIIAVPTAGAYYFDDLAALQSQPLSIAERYRAEPLTPGFQKVREPAEAVSLGLVLDDERIAWGECVSVEFGGQAGRFPIFRAEEGIALIKAHLHPFLLGKNPENFRVLLDQIESLTVKTEVERLVPERKPGEELSRRDLLAAPARLFQKGPTTQRSVEERPLHPALRYGVSQALLQAAALTQGVTMTEVICQAWDLPLPPQPVPIHAQCGADRYDGADKMIARGVASLPHSLVDNLPDHLGEDALKLIRYARWLKTRIQEIGGPDYHPTIHLDVHGGLGNIYDNQAGKILGALSSLEKAVHPYPLRVECPVIMDSRAEQIETLRTLREYLQFRDMNTKIVADEWANTREDIQAFLDAEAVHMIQVKMPDLGGIQETIGAVLACKEAGVEAFLGGSCAETDLSARISAHVALATQPALVMAKPGMGVDEAISIVHNEMARTLAWIKARTE